ncbi:putative xanthine/uracil permease [Venturia nashicola]|uniref:Putative xanthine/uracil permease n=1 Tax=Venturia nashicola TaxID=86259 RepID=A0A4Z1NVJ8_9PEZI|nr:putative xanthine/uracil permease [Venturia nashicola]TLD29656.1 putative xanthine/uracil permease [Venturia nashicola]
MMVPRSFLFQASPGPKSRSPSPSHSSERKEKKAMGISTGKAIPTPNIPAHTKSRTLEPQISAPTEPVRIPSSTPMLIQPRTHATSRRPSPSPHTQTVMSRGQHGRRRHQSTEAHDPSAMPPAVAALLAVTAIPPPKGLARRPRQQSRRVTIDELVNEWKLEGTSSSPSEKFRTPLDILLEPADDDEDNCLADIEDERDGGLLSSRSVSSDSIASSTPSLDPALSTASTFSSGPSTPSLRSRRSSAMKAGGIILSPPTERCDDHPLRPSLANDSDDTVVSHRFTHQSKETIKKKSSFKSNLTASLNALKSAAKSFSNFTATSIPADDMLARSLFSPRFASEMRPKDIDGLADPALRRYLNPVQGVQPPHLSLDDFSSQFQQALAQPADDEPTPMIQMQTYSRSRRRHGKGGKSGAIPGSEKGVMLAPILPAVRQREPRENSDFLRIVVLELNMRRIGKLDMKSAGRARVWLPPRKNNEAEPDRPNRKDMVPVRWRSTSAEDS